ncbi:MAG: DUF2279 domain-containing protein [Bacteroidota bacterium]
MLSGETVAYGGTMTGLYYLWYKDYNHSSFHWFDDRNEWLQMDKAGHFYTSYYFNKAISEGFKITNMSAKQSVIYGSGMSFVFMLSIEIFDGFSEKWGASGSDIFANTFGIGSFACQEFFWKEQRITPKFSYHNTVYSQYRTDALGENLIQRLLKDYNGQTYWLSFNIKSLTGLNSAPSWLNFAFGYSGDGMLGGNNNYWPDMPDDIPEFERKRQYYFSMDFDLTKIKTKSKILKIVFTAVNTVKMPFPAIEFFDNKIKLRPLYF